MAAADVPEIARQVKCLCVCHQSHAGAVVWFCVCVFGGPAPAPAELKEENPHFLRAAKIVQIARANARTTCPRLT
eukprot:3931791-Rhodomonas_salina.2